VVEFQASRGLPETGVVDPNTWHALLSKPLPQ
jgi:peptidoglycan hydrolase-like protein with peptidoglycan-binding domain